MTRRRIVVNSRDKGETEVKRLNFHYCPIKDILTVEGRMFRGEDFRNGYVVGPQSCNVEVRDILLKDENKPEAPTEEVKAIKRRGRNANSSKANQ